MSRLLEHPTVREVSGYLLLGVAASLAWARVRQLVDGARWAIHKAAELVPPPEEPGRLFVVERDGTTHEEVR